MSDEEKIEKIRVICVRECERENKYLNDYKAGFKSGKQEFAVKIMKVIQ